ncbi:TPA: hypothetical protein QEL15_000122 [Stenotrophomonas maltophilia]|nr:hypothetical protein [Stenotrophomonas maltophilia]
MFKRLADVTGGGEERGRIPVQLGRATLKEQGGLLANTTPTRMPEHRQSERCSGLCRQRLDRRR